jgi:hypothetical protein
VFAHACKMGLEGIVSKRRDSFYRTRRLLPRSVVIGSKKNAAHRDFRCALTDFPFLEADRFERKSSPHSRFDETHFEAPLMLRCFRRIQAEH